MADQVWTAARLLEMLQLELEAGPLRAFFFDNAATPSISSVFGDFNEAVDPVTSAPIEWTLSPGSWSYSTPGSDQLATYLPLNMLVNGPLSIYGYAVVDASNVLVYAQLWAGAPVTLPSGLNAVAWTPTVDAQSP